MNLPHTFCHVSVMLLQFPPTPPPSHTLCMLQVDEALVDRFNTVAGIAPILKTHITEVGTQHTRAHIR